jgi:histidyl-tRNA synthetase
VIEPGKLARQFKYADRAGIRFVLMQGSDEIAKGVVTVKDLRCEDQFEVERGEIAIALRERLASATK